MVPIISATAGSGLAWNLSAQQRIISVRTPKGNWAKISSISPSGNGVVRDVVVVVDMNWPWGCGGWGRSYGLGCDRSIDDVENMGGFGVGLLMVKELIQWLGLCEEI